jgi:hypothetical protein
MAGRASARRTSRRDTSTSRASGARPTAAARSQSRPRDALLRGRTRRRARSTLCTRCAGSTAATSGQTSAARSTAWRASAGRTRRRDANVKDKQCEADSCEMQASYGNKTDDLVRFCKPHSRDGDVSLAKLRCVAPGCDARAPGRPRPVAWRCTARSTGGRPSPAAGCCAMARRAGPAGS